MEHLIISNVPAFISGLRLNFPFTEHRATMQVNVFCFFCICWRCGAFSTLILLNFTLIVSCDFWTDLPYICISPGKCISVWVCKQVCIQYHDADLKTYRPAPVATLCRLWFSAVTARFTCLIVYLWQVLNEQYDLNFVCIPAGVN